MSADRDLAQVRPWDRGSATPARLRPQPLTSYEQARRLAERPPGQTLSDAVRSRLPGPRKAIPHGELLAALVAFGSALALLAILLASLFGGWYDATPFYGAPAPAVEAPVVELVAEQAPVDEPPGLLDAIPWQVHLALGGLLALGLVLLYGFVRLLMRAKKKPRRRTLVLWPFRLHFAGARPSSLTVPMPWRTYIVWEAGKDGWKPWDADRD